jgi:hypothetical protein
VNNNDVRLSPWYLNTRRLALMANVHLGTAAQRTLNENSGERAQAMRHAASVADALVRSGRIPQLNKLALAQGEPPARFTAAIWGVFTFRGVSKALMDESDGKKVTAATFSGTIPVGSDDWNVSGALSNDHIYSTTSATYLSGRKRAFIVGQFDFSAPNVEVQPFIIGDFIADVSGTQVLPVGWPQHARVYPAMLDAFSKIANRPAASISKIKELLKIPESDVKLAFAQIIGEPFVPKDWGGEKSDLSTARLTLDGKHISAAFIFKGPSVPGEMHPANLGKRGDQLVRAFDEPVDLVVIQHCNKIANSVARQAEAFAVNPARPRMYCLIDGADTYQILQTYRQLPK